MNFQPVRIGAFVMAMALLGGCALFDDEAADGPRVLDILALGDELQACRANAVVREGIIWLNLGPSPEELDGMQEYMDTNDAVADHRYVDQSETYNEFLEFFADDPELTELVTADQLPTSFQVTLSDEAEVAAVVAEIESIGIVDSVELDPDKANCRAEAAAFLEACDQPSTEVIVWLALDAGPATVEQTSSLLADSPIIADARYVGPDETFAEFETYFADNQEVLDLVDPEQLPTSFIATLTDELRASPDREEKIDTLQESVEAIDGVDDMERGRSEVFDICRAAVGAGPIEDLFAETD